MFDKLIVKFQTDSNGLTDFLITTHYLKQKPRGCSNNFSLWLDNKLVGVAFYGTPIGANVSKSYGKKVLELKRFALADGLPKNTGSWFMSRCHKELKKKQFDGVLTYADTEQNHTGTLYRASNFRFIGKQKQGTPYVNYNNKKIYARNIVNHPKLYSRYLKGSLILKRHKPKLIFFYQLNHKYEARGLL